MSMAMVFPGQGSQSVGMLGQWADNAIVRSHFSEASELLGFDLLTLVTEGDPDTLNQTENAQPALLVSSVAYYAVWKEKGLAVPTWMAGHSLGEFSALVCSGALAFKDAVGLVRKRGQLMQKAGDVNPGAMLAVIGLTDEQIAEVCASCSDKGIVSPANFNAPGQVVASGDLAGITALTTAAKEAGAKMVVPLPVSVASHCSLMQEAATDFKESLMAVSWSMPEIPVLHNVSAAESKDVDALRQALIDQLTQPVRWVQTIQALQQAGADQVVECGVGQVLSKLCKRFKPSISGLSFDKAVQTQGE